MQEGRASRTASRVALRRASHQLLDTPVVFEDPLALRIIHADAAAALRRNPAQFERGRYSMYLRAFLAVRSRIAEDVIAGEIERGVRQIVILGAGLDTFAYRNTRADVRVFEVDHPATQAWKKKRLAETTIAVPPGLTFVPVDFEKQKLRERLVQSGLDPSQPAVFSWLGVSMYLDPAAVWATLGDIAALSAGGGGVIFDYSIPARQMTLWVRFGAWLLARRLRRAGEPFKSWFDPAELTRGLRALGFARITDLGGAELNRRYFAGRADGLRVGSAGHVMIALR